MSSLVPNRPRQERRQSVPCNSKLLWNRCHRWECCCQWLTQSSIQSKQTVGSVFWRSSLWAHPEITTYIVYTRTDTTVITTSAKLTLHSTSNHLIWVGEAIMPTLSLSPWLHWVILAFNILLTSKLQDRPRGGMMVILYVVFTLYPGYPMFVTIPVLSLIVAYSWRDWYCCWYVLMR